MAKRKRNYRQERAAYYGYGNRANVTRTQRLRRREKASRNRARYLMKKKHGKHALVGKDVHHVNGNALDNTARNLSIMNRGKNRSNNKD